MTIGVASSRGVLVFAAVLAASTTPRARAQQGVDRAQAATDVRAAVAETLSRRAMDVLREARDRLRPAGETADAAAVPGLDAARAALIGVEVSPLVTTLGSLESKRLASDPRWAAVLVRQLSGRHVAPGRTVLASFSGSFPGLNLAVMSACRALDLRLVAVSSVTASTWGANVPGFTWPEMEAVIVRAGVLPAASVAVSIGGTRDNGRDLSEEGRALARGIQREAAAALGAQVLEPATLDEAIALRLAVYRAALGRTRPAVYVNVGGNHASLGGAGAPFRHEEGWIEPARGSAGGKQSVMGAWLAEGVATLNLLDVKSLARAWGM